MNRESSSVLELRIQQMHGEILNPMVKISVPFRLQIAFVGCSNASQKYSCALQIDVEFKRGCSIGLKEAG